MSDSFFNLLAGCGGALLPSRVHTVDAGTYMLDMVKNEQERFHFQVCRETKRKGGVPELEATLRGNAEAHCFNPFYGEGGEYAYFFICSCGRSFYRARGLL